MEVPGELEGAAEPGTPVDSGGVGWGHGGGHAGASPPELAGHGGQRYVAGLSGVGLGSAHVWPHGGQRRGAGGVAAGVARMVVARAVAVAGFGKAEGAASASGAGAGPVTGDASGTAGGAGASAISAGMASAAPKPDWEVMAIGVMGAGGLACQATTRTATKASVVTPAPKASRDVGRIRRRCTGPPPRPVARLGRRTAMSAGPQPVRLCRALVGLVAESHRDQPPRRQDFFYAFGAVMKPDGLAGSSGRPPLLLGDFEVTGGPYRSSRDHKTGTKRWRRDAAPSQRDVAKPVS